LNVLEVNHIVYIGGKPTMNYVLAVATQFKDGTPIVMIKARGRSISKAVDVALIVQDRFVENTKVQGISIVTEELTDEGGQPTKVSSIEITLGKV
jgi:archaea-specific DNA-binding protein